ncbi:MAG: hypothetical protein P4L49_16075 [Desulfosporosinus sp.]|nr:hypothetical protein [Desulfosporosinus sp.]
MDLIEIPDKVIYYHRRKETVFNKADLKFDNIIKMTKSRLGTTLYMALTVMKESEIVARKQKGAIEFVYTNNIELNYKPRANEDFQYKFVYNSLFFPLSGDWNQYMIFLPLQKGPLGPLKSPDELLKYLNS